MAKPRHLSQGQANPLGEKVVIHNVLPMRRLPLLLFAFVSLILPGCGGGGGGNSLVDFIYTTDWTGGLASLSQRIRITNPTTGGLIERSMNNDTAGTQFATFNALSSGTYKIEVILYSQPNSGGTILGTITDQISVNSSNKTYLSDIDNAPASLEVKPNNATIQVQNSIQLYAVLKDSLGIHLFSSPSGFGWQALNGQVSVNSEGIAIGQTQGQGQVRATDVSSGLFNSAVINVQPFQTTTSKWTVLVYINAANDLDQFSDLNVNQMERAASNDVRFVVQWKRVQALGFGAPWTATRRYLVKPDSDNGNAWVDVKSDLVQDMGTNVDMGDKATLNQFISWGQTFYPADRYIVVVWNHGAGWRDNDQTPAPTRGVSFDDEFGTYIKTSELSQALAAPTKLEIVSWDSSLMQMLEVAYEIKDQCNYVVGSEESPPGAGLPYDRIFTPLKNNPNQTTESFLPQFGIGMLAEYGETGNITQSSIRTSNLPALASATNSLGQALLDTLGTFNGQIVTARSAATTQAYSPSNPNHPYYRDLYDLAFNLKTLINDTTVDNACDQVMNAIIAAVVHNVHNSNSPRSHGISIEFGNSSQTYWTNYNLLALSVATVWNDWLQVAP